MRYLEEKELVIATHNPGKVKEIADLLNPYIEKFYSAGELGLSESEETGSTFEENAVLKARAAVEESGKPALADDSGLAVNALNGQPGIYSARWAGPEKDFNAAMRKVNNELIKASSRSSLSSRRKPGSCSSEPEDSVLRRNNEFIEDRSAAFICVLALAWPDGHVETFEGRVKGNIIWPPKGDKGFGYDPVFIADGYDITFGEMDPVEKHKISHRANAFKKLVDLCFQKT